MTEIESRPPVTRDDVSRVLALMNGFPGVWFVAGGWSIDLLRDGAIRDHSDLEISLDREDQASLQTWLDDFTLSKAVETPSGGDWVPWEPGERLELPIFQILARRQGWPEFEFFLNDVTDREWYFRPNRQIHRPWVEVRTVSPAGIPVIVPEVQLLHKSRRHEPKDEHDFERALPVMTATQRGWLRDALAIVRPGDAWMERL